MPAKSSSNFKRGQTEKRKTRCWQILKLQQGLDPYPGFVWPDFASSVAERGDAVPSVEAASGAVGPCSDSD